MTTHGGLPGTSRPDRGAVLPWKILIVDDDEDVHEVTTLALKRSDILGHPLAFLHAYSAAEALALLRGDPDVALVLLDAIMETEDAGLEAARAIREDLEMEDVRIVLRTGQPGQIPELESITRYDINDYRTKSELTRERLITVVTAALRSWRQIRRIQNSRRGLELIVKASNQFIAAEGITSFAEGVISQMASLFDLEPEGLVCASFAPPDRRGSPETACGDGDRSCQIIAAAGRFRGLIDRRVTELEDDRIRSAITRAFEHRETVHEDSSLTVYFREPSGQEFATWIDSPRPITEIDHDLLGVFCTNISLSAANISLVDRLQKLAWTDQLLGIPNLTALLERVRSVLSASAGTDTILALCDIDDFGAINDVLGHGYGDNVLRDVARRLQEVFGESGTVYRVGADAFGVVTRREVMETVADAITTGLFEGISRGHPEITMSVGVALIDLQEGDPSNQLQNAFIAMKRARRAGSGQIAWYTPEIGTRTRERLQLLKHLKDAFSEHRLYLAFQPQAALDDGRITGVEALVRWRDESGRNIPPDEFIPLAERSGLIIPLGYWILDQALTALSRVHGAGHPELTLAVNVSANQLKHASFLERLDDAVARNGIEPQALELEITESISMFGIDDVLKLLTAVRSRGIGIAVDDFGTGYSSLSSIDRWPISRIKIDRSFVAGVGSESNRGRLVDLVVPIGHRLSVRVLAEGVETAAQWEQLHEIGCHDAQGYYLGAPMPLDELLEWLDRRRFGAPGG